LPPIADMFSVEIDVCFVPIADIQFGVDYLERSLP